MPALLEVRGLEAQYGPSKVLHGLDFGVEEGGITTILGANGAGKTTTLRAVAGAQVMDLPFGTQKRVELARALAAQPRLLLLDEPAGGLNHEEVGTLMELLRQVRERLGLTMLLVEHHMNLVMRVSDQVVALDFGRVIADGSPAQVQADADVIRAYLGGQG